MQRVRRLFVWVMVALWLPATLHCAMERAGIFAAKPACCDDDANHVADANDCGPRCDLLGGGTQKQVNDLVKAPAPVPLACLSHFAALLPNEPILVPLITSNRVESPPGLSRTWQFVERAALSPRAPSLAS